MTTTYTAQATAIPPQTVSFNAQQPAGTITNISCNGPMSGTLYDGAGNLLETVHFTHATNRTVSYAFTGGSPIFAAKSGSTITLTYTA